MAAVSSRKVVIDAGAAIRLQRLERFGGELVTTSNVLAEIKDEKARALLATLPVELKVREPLTQDIAFVKRFAQGTGDLKTLSQNDIELMALTVALHREEGGEPLREKPIAPDLGDGNVSFEWAPGNWGGKEDPKQWTGWTGVPNASRQGEEKAADGTAAKAAEGAAAAEVAEGAASPEAAAAGSSAAAPEDCCAAAEAAAPRDAASDLASGGAALSAEAVAAAVQEVAAPEAAPAEEDEEDDDDGFTPVKKSGKPVVKEPVVVEEEEEDSWDEDSEDGSSAGEWVTEENLKHFGQSCAGQDKVGKVTCATSDYAMQNVLLQIGITPLTFDGYAVNEVRIWGLFCRACFFFTRDVMKMFCPKCGNDTVVRVPIVVGEDGKATMQHCGRRLRKKGTIYTIPKPTTGRGWKPIFAEDELQIGGRARFLRYKQKLADKERQARNPFDEDNAARAWYQRGTTSTGKMLHTDMPKIEVGYGKHNPHSSATRKRATGKRK